MRNSTQDEYRNPGVRKHFSRFAAKQQGTQTTPPLRDHADQIAALLARASMISSWTMLLSGFGLNNARSLESQLPATSYQSVAAIPVLGNQKHPDIC